MVEIETILNDRPLPYISTDLNHYVHHTCSMEDELYHYLPYPLVSNNPNDPDYLPTQIHGMYTHQTQLIQHFQNRWKQEYLTALREFHKLKGTYAPQMIKIGDVVLIHNDSPRAMAVIENLIKGNDGEPVRRWQ